MNDKTSSFLSEGLKVYPEARATVTLFEQEIINLLSAATKRRTQWFQLKDHRVKSIKAYVASRMGVEHSYICQRPIQPTSGNR
jgi:hypothetical protein